jgi:hypothetical protein
MQMPGGVCHVAQTTRRIPLTPTYGLAWLSNCVGKKRLIGFVHQMRYGGMRPHLRIPRAILVVVAAALGPAVIACGKQPVTWILNPPDLETVMLDNTSESGGYNVRPTADGGYVVAGTSTRRDHSRDMCVWKFRADLSLDAAFGNRGR